MTFNVQLSYVTHFYNNLEQARRVASMLSKVPKDVRDDIEVIFIDDGSAEGGSIDFGELNVKYIRILDDIPWNQAGARNLGFSLASGRGVFFTDIDHILDEEGLRNVIAASTKLSDKQMYRFGRRLIGVREFIHSHVNTFLVSRKGFESSGGYDLDFTGAYGHEDTFLEFVWKLKGGILAELSTAVLLFKGAGTAGLSRSTERNEALLHRKRDDRYVPPSPPRLPNVRWIAATKTASGHSFASES
ncbi:glycosyltransferase family 2 protein [Acidisoma sp. S159]|uniref:glycosyltransferase family 2 protein n=1 Tax=Acidisoma sp. S159 TaxID=1747225 RepID=UPI00131A9D7C|nr:glycosyltransferase family A protein [Acidisoma sp. S159]